MVLISDIDAHTVWPLVIFDITVPPSIFFLKKSGVVPRTQKEDAVEDITMEYTIWPCSRADRLLEDTRNRCFADDNWFTEKCMYQIIDASHFWLYSLLRYDHEAVRDAAYWFYERRMQGCHRYSHDEKSDWNRALSELAEPVALLLVDPSRFRGEIELKRFGATEPNRGFERHLICSFTKQQQDIRRFRRVFAKVERANTKMRNMFEAAGFFTSALAADHEYIEMHFHL